MARTYSAIMALIGLQVVLLRGMKDGAGFDATIASGLCWMVLFGAIGLVVGALAEKTVDESVRTKIEAELTAIPGMNQGTESATAA